MGATVSHVVDSGHLTILSRGKSGTYSLVLIFLKWYKEVSQSKGSHEGSQIGL